MKPVDEVSKFLPSKNLFSSLRVYVFFPLQYSNLAFIILTEDEVLDQFELILPLVLQHTLEVFLPAGDVDGVDGLIHHLSRRRLSLCLTRCMMVGGQNSRKRSRPPPPNVTVT